MNAIAMALQSGHCPQGLHLKLGINQFGDEGMNAIARALQSGHCPVGLQLDFASTRKISTAGIDAIATALQSGHCPSGLHLKLENTQLGATEAQAIATALQSGFCPQGLQLDLGGNELGDEGLSAIAMALQSGRCPHGLQLDLWGNKISAKGASAIAAALQSGHCPPVLQLKLGINQMGDEGMDAIAIALQSGYCPPGLRLILWANQIGTAGVQAIAAALQSGHCPDGLHLELQGNSLSTEDEATLQVAWNTYYRENPLRCIALQQGQRQVDSPISRLPQDVLNAIYCAIVPTTPIASKMTEISAKVFRHGYALGLVAEKSLAVDQLDQAYEMALSAKTLTQRTEQIKGATKRFLKHESRTLNAGEFATSPAIALLCKYHLITGNRINKASRHRDTVQLNEQPSKYLKF